MKIIERIREINSDIQISRIKKEIGSNIKKVIDTGHVTVGQVNYLVDNPEIALLYEDITKAVHEGDLESARKKVAESNYATKLVLAQLYLQEIENNK